MVHAIQRAASSLLQLACISVASVGPAVLADERMDDGDVIDEIVVTGSRLGRTERNTPAPVEIIRADDIAASAASSVADIARSLTYNNGVPNDAALELSPIAGASFFNLRGIGAQNTLVLVNGKRVSPYGASQANGQTIVDVNSIPASAIDRIEILKDGASAVYGSDAVAGVVNIILKQHVHGLQVGAGAMSTSRADQAESTLDASWGTVRGDMTFLATASYQRRGRLRARDRGFLDDGDLRHTGGFNNRSNFSSPLTALRLPINEVHAEPDCPVDESNPLVFVEVFPRPHPILKSFCKFNTRLFADAMPRSERAALGAVLDHALTSRTSLSADAFFSRNETSFDLPPDPTDRTGAGNGFPSVMADHPFNPFGEELGIMYRVIDAGPRTRNVVAEAGRVVADLRHDADRWNIGLSAQASFSEAAISDHNVIDAAAFQDALLGLGGTQGSSYYNPFGRDVRNPDDVVSVLRVDVTRRSERFRERSADLSATRELWRLAGGGMQLALGAQYRDQKGYGIADDFQRTGVALGLDLLRPFAAKRQVLAAYAELSVPLAESVDVQAALRRERYSDFGSSTNPKLAILWRAADRLALRASLGTSFRAPSFAELYRARRETLSFERDEARCSITGAPLDCSRYPYRTLSGGNPLLQPEEGRSLYLGITLEDAARDGTSLSAGWWQIDHDDRVIEPGARFILENFGLDPDFVVRSAPPPTEPPGTPGRIELINSFAFNLETLQTRGIDVAGRWRPGFAGGDLDLRLDATYLDRYRTAITSVGARDVELAGTAELFPLPRVRSRASAIWRAPTGSVVVVAHFTGAYRSPLNLVVGGAESDIPYRVDDHLTFDLQYARPIGRDGATIVRIGCRNCFDAAPPDYNYTTIGEYLHDPRGAIIYVRVASEIR